MPLLELIGGAALGAVFGELLKLVVDRTEQIAEFDTLLARLETTLKGIQPVFLKITELNNRPVEERTTLRSLLDEGKELVVKCSGIKSRDVRMKNKYSKELIDLDIKLFRFFEIGAFEGILTKLQASSGLFCPCVVPGLPEFTIGLDQHLPELKRMLLKDDTKVLVVSAPGGFGKTTLAKKFCHDDEIKGIFGDHNILFVTVSSEPSLKSIAQSLFKHYDITKYDLKTEEDAKNQIENLVKQKGSGKMLLVLDDVWPNSASIIQDLKFDIPGYKILVTSRYSFPEFNCTYKLEFLNAEYAKTLFCHSAFPTGRIPDNNVPDDLVNEMVESCKGIPLALTVVGASLSGQTDLVKWRATLKRWSRGQSILESHDELLCCLQTSIDALDEVCKKCFLDLGLFPEDCQIPGMALLDMWVELYELDDEGTLAGENLYDLKLRNLINLVPIRKVAGETEDYCRQYYVTQHDVLRELAIHRSRQGPTVERERPAAERERLIVEIHGNKFPKWWTQQPVIAHILSISTDGEFSSTWDDLNAPNVEVLILNIRSEKYTLPDFIKKMIQLKIGNALSSGTTGSTYMLENLKDFEIDFCYDLKELPAGLCSSVQLKKLIITNCQELDALPEELGNLLNLEILGLHCCTKLKELPESVGSLHKLSSIDISDCSHMSALPTQIGELSSLKVIAISGCEGLQKLPKSLAELKKIEALICDEERLYLWKNIASDHSEVKINLVEEDRYGTFTKICQ
ncbi:putative powdery mildew resistance protein, RPW8 [Helianthus debilis subsp. tardiflorus]